MPPPSIPAAGLPGLPLLDGCCLSRGATTTERGKRNESFRSFACQQMRHFRYPVAARLSPAPPPLPLLTPSLPTPPPPPRTGVWQAAMHRRTGEKGRSSRDTAADSFLSHVDPEEMGGELTDEVLWRRRRSGQGNKRRSEAVVPCDTINTNADIRLWSFAFCGELISATKNWRHNGRQEKDLRKWKHMAPVPG